MSFSGILLRVEDAPPGDGRAWNKPDYVYPRWKMTVRNRFGAEQSASTGNQGYIERARELIGKLVHISQGGKEGIVGGIQPMSPKDMVKGLELSGWKQKLRHIWKSPSGKLHLGPAGAYRILCLGT
jgi:hypothetical protein